MARGLAVGAPLPAVMAFWLSSPLIDPPTLLITAGALGWDFAIGKALAAVGLGLFGGFAMQAAISGGWFSDPLRPRSGGGCGCSKSPFGGSPVWKFWHEESRNAVFRSEIATNTLFLVKWLALAYVLEALLILYVPASLIAGLVGGEGLLPIGIAAGLGTFGTEIDVVEYQNNTSEPADDAFFISSMSDDYYEIATAASGTAMPGQRQALFSETGGLIWMSPDELLLLCPYNDVAATVQTLTRVLAKSHTHVANVSDARAMFTVSGPAAREVLAKLCPVDFAPDAFAPGQIRRTRMAQVPAAIWQDGDDSFRVICFRSVADYVFGALKAAAAKGSEVAYF